MKKYIIFLAYLFIALIIVSCTNSGSNEKENQKEHLRVGMIPITDCSQLFVAKEFGIFAKYGIEVELIPVGGGSQILQSLASNDLDVAFSNLTSIVFFEKNFEELVSLSGGTLMNEEYTEGGLVCLENNGINSIDDFRGKTIAVNSLNNIVHLAVVKILKKNGINPTEVTIVEMKFSDMPSALSSKRIDVATLPEPILSLSMNEGSFKNFGDYIVLAFDEYYVTGYFTTNNVYSKSKSKLDKFNKSIQESTEILNTFNDSVINAISKYTKVSPEVIKTAGKPLFVNEVPEDALDKMSNWLYEESFIK